MNSSSILKKYTIIRGHYEEYIPRWNEKFSRETRDKRLAYRTILTGLELRDILCIKEKRKVRSDNTISYRGRVYQILSDGFRSSYVKAEVEVYEHIEGDISILHKGNRLRYREIGLVDSVEVDKSSLVLEEIISGG